MTANPIGRTAPACVKAAIAKARKSFF